MKDVYNMMMLTIRAWNSGWMHDPFEPAGARVKKVWRQRSEDPRNLDDPEVSEDEKELPE